MKQRRHSFCIALIASVLCAVLWAVVPASAGLDFSSGACVEFADELEPLEPMPVACEVAACCPGCPGNDINWRIRVSGGPLESVLLQFENLPPEAVRRLRIKGKARWEGSALRVMPGETVVSGFKYDPRAVPAVATPRLFANKKLLGQLREAAEREAAAPARLAGPVARPAADRDLGRMEVAVEQLMGKYVVNEARIAYNLTKCTGLPGSTDHVLLNNNTGDDLAAVFLDARTPDGLTTKCINDERFMGKGGNILVGDLRGVGSCNAEMSVFSTDNAMAFVKPVFWTDSAFDEQPVTLQPLREAPVAVWIVASESGTQERAEWEMASANYYYNTNRVGIAFNAAFRDVSANAAARDIIGNDCSKVDSIKDSDFYKPKQLNVYYVEDPERKRRGGNCYLEPNIIFITNWSDQETLAHEFGHAFSLNHPNGCPFDEINGMPGIISRQNIMWEREQGRTRFTLGQAFRMNLNVTSMLNVNGVRTGLVRSPPCAEVEDSDECPRLDMDAP